MIPTFSLEEEYDRQPPIGRGNIKIKYVEYCEIIRVFLK